MNADFERADFYDHNVSKVVRVTSIDKLNNSETCGGCFIDKKGLILTMSGTLKDSREVRVYTTVDDHPFYHANIISKDNVFALLKMIDGPRDPFSFVQFSIEQRDRRGNEIRCIFHPNRMNFSYHIGEISKDNRSISEIVNSKMSNSELYVDERKLGDVIESNICPIADIPPLLQLYNIHGHTNYSKGGPIFDNRGNVIAIYLLYWPLGNIDFAIPARNATKFLTKAGVSSYTVGDHLYHLPPTTRCILPCRFRAPWSYREELENFFAIHSPKVVHIQFGVYSLGAGCFINNNAQVLTMAPEFNCKGLEYMIRTHNNTLYNATFVHQKDKFLILQLEHDLDETFPCVKFEDNADEVLIGAEVRSVFHHDDRRSSCVVGRISYCKRMLRHEDMKYLPNYIKPACAFSVLQLNNLHGSNIRCKGSPIFNIQGRVIGIHAFSNHYDYAIRSEHVKYYIENSTIFDEGDEGSSKSIRKKRGKKALFKT